MARHAPQFLLKTLLLVAAAGLLFRELVQPGGHLDASCMLALQDGFLKGTDFGRYLTNTYGLLSFLVSGVFHPGTYRLSIAFQVICILVVFWPAVHLRWSARFVFAMLLCLICNRLVYLTDPFIFAALYSAFILAVLDRRPAALAGAAVLGVFALAKWSVLFVALPLFVLADLRTLLVKRALPLQSITFLGAIVVGFLLAGQPLASLPLYFRNGYEIARFFGLAVTSLRTGMPLEAQLLFVGCAAVLALVLFSHARAAYRAGEAMARDAGAQLLLLGFGWVWVFFALYHASYIRPDGGHYYIGWNAFLVTLPVALFVAASLRRGEATLRRRDVSFAIVACAVYLVAADYPPLWREAGVRGLPARLYSGVTGKVQSARALLAWADRGKLRRFKKARVAALQAIAVRDVRIGRETIDVYPFDLAPVLAADLAYQPRPTMQAQVAYTPYLQRLDLEHWRGPNAPLHLLFQLGDIDGRLPTLALGPSIVEVLARYTPVGRVEPALHLRRRQTPLPISERALTSTTAAMDQWVSVPNSKGALTLARIRLPQTLAGRLLNLVKPPFLMIDVKYSTGVVGEYRFVPSMAELGFAISPELESLLGTLVHPGRPEIDLLSGLERSATAKAFRIREVGSLGQYAFEPADVAFSCVQFR